MKRAYIVAFFVISIAMGFTMWAFSSAATPYVNIATARQLGTPAQVRGKILRNPADLKPGESAPHYDTQRGALRFWIEDENKQRVEVIYRNAKPDAFDQAPETAALGIVKGDTLNADQLIIKCPSKYEGGKVDYKKAGGRA